MNDSDTTLEKRIRNKTRFLLCRHFLKFQIQLEQGRRSTTNFECNASINLKSLVFTRHRINICLFSPRSIQHESRYSPGLASLPSRGSQTRYADISNPARPAWYHSS